VSKKRNHSFRAFTITTQGLLASICLYVTLTSSGLRAQESATSEIRPRPRIGLVLSGGGARGTAHVGVLKVLDEMHIPIDAIAGTSMGAVVGGLYASGMSAKDIEKLTSSLDWQDAFRDRPPRRAFGYRRKQDDSNFLVHYSMGISSDGFNMPLGLVQGQKLTQILRSSTVGVANIKNFDHLPIAYRAVATDLETGEGVILDSGDLVTAMRASMSAPGVFEPVEVNGRLLVDGGLYNNLPVDIARQMNVDILIVVDVTFPLYPRNELTSPLAASNQAVSILIRRRTLEQRASVGENDVLITPDLGSMSAVDFGRVAQAMSKGEQAARKLQDKLSALSVSQEDYSRYLASREAQQEVTPKIDFISTDAASKRYAKVVSLATNNLAGRPLDFITLNNDLASLYALDVFESIDYNIVHRGDQTGLVFHLKRKSWGPNYVRVGINLEDDFSGNTKYNFAARLIMAELNSLGAEWLTDFQIGDHPRILTEFYQPLNVRNRYFVAPRFEFGTRSLQILDSNNKHVAEYRVRATKGNLDFGREFSDWGEIRAGLFRGKGTSILNIGDPLALAASDSLRPPEHFDIGGYFARFSYDTLDSVYFPRQGAQVVVQLDADRIRMGADHNLNKISTQWQLANSFGRHIIVLSAAAGSTLSAKSSPDDYFTLGGFLNLSGVTTDSLSGPHYGIARIVYYRQIGRGGTGVLELPAYAGVSFEVGNTWTRRTDASFSSLRHDYSLFFGADTPLGPLYLAGGYDDRHQTAFYLFLGRSF
jgi:NTE family protein